MKHEEYPFELLPAIVQDYLEVCQPCTEAPDEFLSATFLFVASVLSGRWFEFNNQFLNDYYLLTGSTGTAKKSTAQSLANRLLLEILKPMKHLICTPPNSDENNKNYIGPKEAYPFVTQFSIEGLQTHAIGKGTSTGVIMGEYGTLFDISKRQGQQNTISELTNLYDGNPIRVRTLGRKSDASEYSLSLLAASTVSWLQDFFSKRNISGGFVNRHLIIDSTAKRILSKPNKPSGPRWDAIIEYMRSLIPSDLKAEMINGEIHWSASRRIIQWHPKVEKAWDHLYTERTKELRSIESKNPTLVELAGRELTHAIKLTGLKAFLDDRKEVKMDDLVFGIRFARWSIYNLLKIAQPSHFRKPYWMDKASEQVLAKVSTYGPMTKTKLARSLGGNQADYNRAIDHLLRDGHLGLTAAEELRICNPTPNCQDPKIQNLFGKTDIYGLLQNSELGVESTNYENS